MKSEKAKIAFSLSLSEQTLLFPTQNREAGWNKRKVNLQK